MGRDIGPNDASLLASYCADLRAGITPAQARLDIMFHNKWCYKILDAFEGKEAPKDAIAVMKDLKKWAGR